MQDDRPELRIWPEWGNWEIAGTLTPLLSPHVRDRLRTWNDVWQNELNPQTGDARWPDPDIGHQWILEGEALVAAVQAELGPSWRVTNGFAAYDPDTMTNG